ncbi:MAG TPA: oligopeptide transporter, OPT family [Stellaceae bacterium]|nr:oligopeptide transporter, OPT family [Stellaceae bacterium]
MTSGPPPASSVPRRELTLRGLVLGALITAVFTAANVYFGLKAALTFASSIPAAVISMAVLRGFKGATIQENNIVQTVASAAGALASVVFVLPGLVMIGWWTGFPFWLTFSLCAFGGILGVTYSIPLRRALVTGSDLPYPEGVACAEVLRVGTGEHGAAEGDSPYGADAGRAGLLAVIWGAIASATYLVIVNTQLFAADVARYFRVGRGASGLDFGLSLALYGVGHLVGLWVGVAALVGILIAWAGLIPIMYGMDPPPGPLADAVLDIWEHKVRFIGAGQMGVAAIWSLLRLAGPVLGGLRAALAASRARRRSGGLALAIEEQDLPVGWTGLITLACLVAIGGTLAFLAQSAGLGAATTVLVLGGVVYVVVIGLFVATVCGYMAGLVGSSNSPVSGVGILAVLVAALLMATAVRPLVGAEAGPALVAFALFATTFVFSAAIIGNDNLQDLKTGQLVGATPWKQQVALIVGVVVGAAIIPPVLDLLNRAYGFAGTPGVDPAHALAAPQAALISTLASGVIRGELDWTLIGVGVVIGTVIVAIDEALGLMKKPRLPPLAVGLGVYLPMATTLTVTVGAIGGWVFERWSARRKEAPALKHLGVLLASGLIVGEGLIGVILAGIVVASGSPTPLALVQNGPVPEILGVAAFAGTLLALHAWLGRLARSAG